MKDPYITIVIPTKNRRDSLKKTLDSLVKQKFKDFEVVVSDGNSTDGSREMLETYKSKLKISLADGEGGLVLAMNNACRKAKGEIIIRTDDDIVASPQWLGEIQKTFVDKRVGGVTGPTIIPRDYLNNRDIFSSQENFKKGNIFWRLLGKIYFDYFMEGDPYRVSHWFNCGAFSLGSNYEDCLKIPQNLEVDNLEACNFAVRAKLLEKVGWFDKKYTGVGEYHEPDAALKIQKLGFKLIFNPKAKIFHCPVQTGIYNARPKAYSRAQNFINFYFRHIRPNTFNKAFRFYLYLVFVNLYWFRKFLTTGQWRELGAVPGTVIAVFKNLTGLTKNG